MKTVAHVKNSDGSILKFQQVPDDFDATTVAHLFGPEFEVSLLPVVDDPLPTTDSTTCVQAVAPRVENNTVVRGWTVVTKPVPPEVANWQLEEEMYARGLIDQLNAAIAAIPDPIVRSRAESRWAKKPILKRSDPLIASVAHLLGLTSDQVDSIFRSASMR